MASNVWTQTGITEWAVKTFGRPSNALHMVDRAKKEFDELYELTHFWDDELNDWRECPLKVKFVEVDKVLEEAADIVIVLSQLFEHLGGDMQEEIAKKMIKNVNRQWIVTGDGVGRHT